MKKKTIWITAGSIAAALVIGGVGIAVADSFDNDSLSGSALDQASAAALAQVGDGRVTDTELSDDFNHRYEIEVTRDNLERVDVYLDEAFAVVGLDTDTRTDDQSTAPSGAPNTYTDDQPISESERASASAAALAQAGIGQVTELDRSDDLDHAWEVEVTLDTGADIDIELDTNFTVTRVDNN